MCELLRKIAAKGLAAPVTLVLDNARYQKCALVQNLASSLGIELLYLPGYSPNLNLIERLWGHLKRTVLANVLFATLDDLVAAFRRGVGRVNGHRDRMDFMFRHDDVLGRKAA